MKKIIFLFVVLLFAACENKTTHLIKLSSKYPKVANVGWNQYIAVDTKGNIHYISTMMENDITIIEFQEIEESLNRECPKTFNSFK